MPLPALPRLRPPRPAAPALLLAAALLAGCGAPPPADPDAPRPVTLRFEARVGERPFACGDRYPGVGLTRSVLTPSDLRFHVSEIRLIDAEGRESPLALTPDGTWQLDDVALLDFENGSGPCRHGTSATRTQVQGQVRMRGQPVGLRLTLGVPAARLAAGARQAPAPLHLPAMDWGPAHGRMHLKFDTATTGMPAAPGPSPVSFSPGSASGFSVHVGSVDCGEGGACRQPMHVAVRLDRFDPARDVIVADLAALLAETHLDTNAPGTPPGCMTLAPADPDCRAILAALGLPAADGTPGGPQRFLRAAPAR